MYKKIKAAKTLMRVNESVEGETIEAKVRKIMASGEGITDEAPLIYTERKEGVLPGYDIRTDRFEVAIDAHEKIDKSKKAERHERHKSPEEKEADRIKKEAKENMKKEGEQDAKSN